MRKTNLSIFYHLGAALEDLKKLQIGMEMGQLILMFCYPQQWLHAFLEQTESMPMPDSRDSARRLFDTINSIASTESPLFDISHTLSQDEILNIGWGLTKFEKDFEREHHNLDAFTLLPKGIFDTRLLVESPEKQFPNRIVKILPAQTLYDLREAGRCLAFEVHTACAFHVCRAAESMMLAYYEVLSGKPWPHTKRDWKIYCEQLCKCGAPESVTTRIDEIRRLDRNTYTHPERNVTAEEAPHVFNLCSALMFQMGKEIADKATGTAVP